LLGCFLDAEALTPLTTSQSIPHLPIILGTVSWVRLQKPRKGLHQLAKVRYTQMHGLPAPAPAPHALPVGTCIDSSDQIPLTAVEELIWSTRRQNSGFFQGVNKSQNRYKAHP
jgi:hypothetical protein